MNIFKPFIPLTLAFALVAGPTESWAHDPDELADTVENVMLPATVNIEVLEEKAGVLTGEVSSKGAGVVIDGKNRYIVTNDHVLADGKHIKVIYDNGATFDASVVGRDETTDLAVIKFGYNRDVPFAQFGDSDAVRITHPVVAIGNPRGLHSSVSMGIVSQKNRSISKSIFKDFIQTDAAVNKGNSGGGLFNHDGELIGMNTAILSDTDYSAGLAFAIPSNRVEAVTQNLIECGKAACGWLGANFERVTTTIADRLGLGELRGAFINSLEEGSPLAAGGVQEGDVLLKYNDQPINVSSDFKALFIYSSAGDKVPIRIWRGGQEYVGEVTVGTKPQP